LIQYVQLKATNVDDLGSVSALNQDVTH